MFPRRDVDGSENLRFVGFPVADERPDFAAVSGFQATTFEVFRESRLIDSARRRQTHAGRGHLPEVGHAARVRIGRHAAPFPELATKIP